MGKSTTLKKRKHSKQSNKTKKREIKKVEKVLNQGVVLLNLKKKKSSHVIVTKDWVK